MNLLVTGSTGLVGRALCVHLRDLGWAVRGVSRQASDPVGQQSVVQIRSIDEDTDWRGALRGIDVVLHLAARVHIMQDRSADPLAEFRRVNVHGTLNLARQAASAGVRRLVFVSSVKVHGEATVSGRPFTELDPLLPQDAYGQSKIEAKPGLQMIAMQTGLELVIVRPPLVYGPGVKANFAALMRAVQQGWPLPLGAVQNLRSLVALDNLVDFLSLCASHPRAAQQSFLISDGQDVSTPQLLREMAHALGRPARLLPLPVPVLRALGRLSGQSAAIDRLCGNLQLDISKARTLLGWTPVLGLSEGLRKACHNCYV